MSDRPPPPFHIVLVEPEIPNNTGNIGRTCVAVGAALHLVHPLAFSLNEKACRRSGLDYWPRLRLTEHSSLRAYFAASPGARRWYFTTRATASALDVAFQPGDHLLFGCETRGLPEHALQIEPDRLAALPMAEGERSLNLASSAAAVAYLALDRLIRSGSVRMRNGTRLPSVSTPHAPPDFPLQG